MTTTTETHPASETAAALALHAADLHTSCEALTGTVERAAARPDDAEARSHLEEHLADVERVLQEMGEMVAEVRRWRICG